MRCGSHAHGPRGRSDPRMSGAHSRLPVGLLCTYYHTSRPVARSHLVLRVRRAAPAALPCPCPGAAAEAYEQFKRRFLDTAADCQRQGISFIPIVGESSGGWGPSALCVFKALARSIANSTGRDAAEVLREHRQALGVFLRQANARAIFRRDPGSVPPVGDVFASARLALEA